MANRREFIKKAGLAVGASAALSGVASAVPSIPESTIARKTISAKELASLTEAGYKLIPRVAGYGDLTSPETRNGLPMDVFRKGDRVYSWVTIPENFAGWKGPNTTYAHDGALATILTTVSGFQAMVATKQPTRHRTLSVNFAEHAVIGEKLRAEARVTARPSDQQLAIEASVYDADGKLLASSSAVWEVCSEDVAVICQVQATTAFHRNMETHFANG